MANTDFPHGLNPISSPHGGIRRTPYDKTASTALFLGDPVTMVAAGTVQRAAAGQVLLGVVEGIFDSTGKPVNYVAASDADAYTVMVADDPDQLFEAQEDSGGAALAAADVGMNCDILVTDGDTGTGKSKVEIDSSTKLSASGQLRLIKIVDRVDNAIGTNCDWVVQINEHQLKATAGI